jgi:N-acetylated-alpha-linked acidic dipeptidase
MRLLSEEPHEAGTERSRRVAELILQRFRSYGLDARIERFEALMPRPVARSLELLAPTRYTAVLKEPAYAEDKDSDDADQLPTYNAYSADGDVTAPLVYANFGLPDDYRVLDSLGIDVRGKIVIVRYGGSWRGIKPKLAHEHGAVGTIIYSDPRDDGYWPDDVYPAGPMRPEHGVQRGSVMDMPTYPGDPLSPGWSSVEGSRRLAREEAATLVAIPVLPISYGDALPLLRALRGPVAPESWRGALPITYHIGGDTTARVRLALRFDWQTRPLYNVIARIPGSTWPEQMVVYGNHHDAWVNGAEDPISGMVTVLEAGRAFGTLLKSGWRPQRTIVLAAWDGEEWGLLGSTEWVEHHGEALRRGGVLYLNSDTYGRGWLSVSGSHSLERFFEEVARDIRDPKSGESALEVLLRRERERRARRAKANDDADAPDSSAADSSKADPVAFRIDALGSGSDYTAFLDWTNIPTIHANFGGESRDGIYHSIYDSFDHYTRFNDTTFRYGVAQAQTGGTAVLRMADAPVLPYEFGSVARTYRTYVDEIAKEAAKSDSTKALDLAPVRAALDRLDSAAIRLETAMASVSAAPSARLRANRARLAEVNRLLHQSEQALGDTAGLPRRPWFRHLIYAPGFYTGYGVKTMPGIREAVEQRDLVEARRESARVAAAIDRLTASVDRAAAGLAEVVGRR